MVNWCLIDGQWHLTDGQWCLADGSCGLTDAWYWLMADDGADSELVVEWWIMVANDDNVHIIVDTGQ